MIAWTLVKSPENKYHNNKYYNVDYINKYHNVDY